MSEMPVRDRCIEQFTARVVLLFLVASNILALGWILSYGQYGIDFTDEGYYLTWMSNPFNYSASATQFGFVYHPLYEILQGNIAGLRRVNTLINFSLSLVLGSVFFNTAFDNQSISKVYRIAISGTIATVAATAQIFGGEWNPTLSYNSLAMQALLVAAIGLLLADKYVKRTSIIGWLLIGIGGWLAFMAKPTTALALAACSIFYLLFSSKYNLRLLLISIATSAALIVLSAFAIDGSIFIFFDRLKNGAEIYSSLNAGHEKWLRMDDFPLGNKSLIILFSCTVVIFLTSLLSQSKIIGFASSAAVIPLVFCLAGFSVAFGVLEVSFPDKVFQGLFILSIPLASIFTGVSIYKFKGILRLSRAQWAIVFIFMAFPYIYAFGSANNYWIPASAAGVFWIFAGLVFLNSIASGRRFVALLLPFSFAVQMMSLIQVRSGIESPYRQPQPLYANDYMLEYGKPASSLMLSRDFGQYIKEAIDLANKAGFEKETPIIDLTGQSPGLLYALNASSIGQAWTVGGYPGSEALAIAMLKKVPCRDIARAWLLMEPEGPRKISPKILSNFGANLATDFEVVARFKTAKGAGGYNEARLQKLLKPVRSVEDAVTACSAETAAKN